ncbi:hypothetical protein LDENG_00170740 [Lucifuga dentata]|nr:hypothetical protein LDENG_00170740 [Lucifuga dentata]
MSWLSWLLTLWPSSALSLLLVGMVGKQVGLRVGLQMVQTVMCSRWGAPSSYGLSQDGDVVIGGLFSLRYQPSAMNHDFTGLQHYTPCTGLELDPLKYMYTMVFAVEEINHNTTLLPGVRLGYHIFDSCGRHPWATQGALSMVGGESTSCSLTNPAFNPDVYGEEIRDRRGLLPGDQPVPLIIGGASSYTAKILSTILGPISVPVISYLASCPCLSDRNRFPNFFRTIPSDIYQARAMAQLTMRFHWTWIGAVIANNDYGHMAIQVFQEEVQGKGVCLAFIETLTRQTIVSDARQAALTVQASSARVILIFSWYTDVRQLFLELVQRNVTGKQFLASEAWSTSDDILQNPAFSKVASGVLGSLRCERCPSEFWSNPERTACIPRVLDFLSFNETLGITLTMAAVSGVMVTTAVFVVFLCHRNTPVVRANNSELSFLLLVSLKLCFLCSLVFIGRPTVWACRFQQAAFGISFVLCVSCLQIKTIVVLAAFRSARPGAEALIRWFGPNQQRGSVCILTCIQVIICVVWLSLSPPEPRPDLGFKGSKVTLECAMTSVVGFALVLGYIGLLACTCLILAFLARKLPDNFNEAKLITFSMLIFCTVWVAFVPAYVSSPGKYTVAVEIFAILASSYGLLLCIFAPKCFIILLRPEKNTKKHLMAR